MTAAPESVATIRALVDVSEVFADLTARLRKVAGVETARQSCWMKRERRLDQVRVRVGDGEGFRFEWYAEAEFDDGRSLVFGQDLSWHGDDWIVSTSIRVVDSRGEEVLTDLPDHRLALTADLGEALPTQAHALAERFEWALMVFNDRRVDD